MRDRKWFLEKICSKIAVDELIAIFKELNFHIEEVKRVSTGEYLAVSIELKKVYKPLQLICKSMQGSDQSDCFTKIDSIVINVQINDIINQKLLHIQQTHEMLVDEFRNLQNSKRNSIDEIALILVLPELAQLHKEQIRIIQAEYISSWDNIRKSLSYVKNVIKLHQVCLKMENFSSLSGNLSENSLGSIINKLERVGSLKSEEDRGSLNDITLEKINQMKSFYTMQSERIIHNKIFAESSKSWKIHLTEDTKAGNIEFF